MIQRAPAFVALFWRSLHHLLLALREQPMISRLAAVALLAHASGTHAQLTPVLFCPYNGATNYDAGARTPR